MSKYMEFWEAPVINAVAVATRRRTKEWQVFSTRDRAELGRVKWFPRWRQYAFFPTPGTIFNPECLVDLADFVEQATITHRTKRKAAKV